MASWTRTSRQVLEAMRQGHELPPIVVFRTAVGWNLIDGVDRSDAAWHLVLTTIRADELIQNSSVEPQSLIAEADKGRR